MLNLFLCTGRTAVQDNDGDLSYAVPTYDPPPRKKASLTKKKTVKLQIGSPTDFKHESHMGYSEIAGLDVAQYQQEVALRIAQMAQTTPDAAPTLRPQPPSQPQIPSYLPSSFSPSPPRRSNTVKRKPVPSMIDPPSGRQPIPEIPTPEPSPTRSISLSRAGDANVTKALVPLLGDGSAGSLTSAGPYVTQTAKLRFDGVLTEIENALRDI